MDSEKQEVRDYWNKASCGEDLYLQQTDSAGYREQSEERYRLEPYVLELAQFESTRGKRVLEIGVGLGADHQRFAEAGADLHGTDLTERAVDHSRRRLRDSGLPSRLTVGDAEQLQYPDECFDVVYSWGVLHHSPDTLKAFGEVWRVLASGGWARLMIYHKWSLVGLMLWTRYALLRMRPWLRLSKIYASQLESPGTKAYSIGEVRRMLAPFSEVKVRTVLTHGDLLESDAGQRHRGPLLALARKTWPRVLFKRFLPWAGLFMLIEARK